MKRKLARMLRKWATWLDPQGKPGRKRTKKADLPLLSGLSVEPEGFVRRNGEVGVAPMELDS
jgi:hypothetical protein